MKFSKVIFNYFLLSILVAVLTIISCSEHEVITVEDDSLGSDSNDEVEYRGANSEYSSYSLGSILLKDYIEDQNSQFNFLASFESSEGEISWENSISSYHPGDGYESYFLPVVNESKNEIQGVILAHRQNRSDDYRISYGSIENIISHQCIPRYQKSWIEIAMYFHNADNRIVIRDGDLQLMEAECYCDEELSLPEGCRFETITICRHEDDVWSGGYDFAPPWVDHDRDGIPNENDQDWFEFKDRVIWSWVQYTGNDYSEFWDYVGSQWNQDVDLVEQYGEWDDFWDHGSNYWNEFWLDYNIHVEILDEYSRFWDDFFGFWNDIGDWFGDIGGDFGDWIGDLWRDIMGTGVECPFDIVETEIDSREEIICHDFRQVVCGDEVSWWQRGGLNDRLYVISHRLDVLSDKYPGFYDDIYEQDLINYIYISDIDVYSNSFEDEVLTLLFELFSKDPDESRAFDWDLELTFMNCFGQNMALDCSQAGNATFFLTLYVDQPNPGHRDPYSGNPFTGIDVGHTFVGLKTDFGGTQKNITFGFYPSFSVNLNNRIGPMVVLDDGNHSFTTSVEIQLTCEQFNDALNAAVEATRFDYDLDNYNCTDFGIVIANSVNLGVDDTTSPWVYLGQTVGSSSNPGDLGEDIKLLSIGAINSNGGTASESTNCN